jgi:hypothetical protein
MEIDPINPSPPPTIATNDDVVTHFRNLIAPRLHCQNCLGQGTFTPAQTKKGTFICRGLDGKCPGRITTEGILLMIDKNLLLPSESIGVPLSSAMPPPNKRTRAPSPECDSKAPKQLPARVLPVNEQANILAEVTNALQVCTSGGDANTVLPAILRSIQFLLQHLTPLQQTQKVAAVAAPQPTTAFVQRNVLSRNTYAAAAAKQTPEQRKKTNDELRKMKYTPPTHPVNQTQKAFEFRQVFVPNLQQRPINEIKTSLFNLRFKLSSVLNIARVAKNTYEFLVKAEYSKEFIRHLERSNFRPLENYDATTPREDNPDPAVVERIKNAALTRIANTIVHTNSNHVRNFYEAFCSEKGWSSALAEKKEQIHLRKQQDSEDEMEETPTTQQEQQPQQTVINAPSSSGGATA